MYLLSDYKNKFEAKYSDNIQDDSLLNKFLTTGTFTVADTIFGHPINLSQVPTIMLTIIARVEETPQISVVRLSTIW
jgi:hypothetical protein